MAWSLTIFGNLHVCRGQEGKSLSTVKAYRAGIEHFERWLGTTYGEVFDPTGVVARDVSDWIAHQQMVQKAAPATINRRLAAVSQFFKWALGEGSVLRDPTVAVDGLRRDRRRPKPFRRAIWRPTPAICEGWRRCWATPRWRR